jgi:3',5'-cyclic AMP phosphodiesterase CpdA
MILVQISDTHLADTEADRGVADPVFAARAENLRRCIADINCLNPRPDAVIHTGDVTHLGRAADFAFARRLLSDLEPPLFMTPGNRDGRGGLADVFVKECRTMNDGAFVHYAVDEFPVRLVALDSLASEGRKGNLCKGRLDALDVTLAAAPARPTAIFMHHPPFDVAGAKDPFQFEGHEAVDALAAVVERHPQVIRIFSGHAHRLRTARVGGAVASTMLSVAVDLRMEDAPGPAFDAPVYMIHRYKPGTGFVSETRSATG